MPASNPRPPQGAPRSLSGLLPFLRPYRARIALAMVFLVLAAGATLLFPVALRSLKGGEQKVMPLAEAVALIKADATPPDLR